MKEITEPVLIETGASVSTGGKVQLKKFELSADYHFSLNGKWAVPPSWTEGQAEEFRHEMVLRLKKELEPLAQAEVDDLLEQKQSWD